MLDLVVDRREMKATLARALRFMGQDRLDPTPDQAGTTGRAIGHNGGHA